MTHDETVAQFERQNNEILKLKMELNKTKSALTNVVKKLNEGDLLKEKLPLPKWKEDKPAEVEKPAEA